MSPRKINFPETWSRLSETVSRVMSSLPLKKAVWNDRFTDVYSICSAYPETLNEALYQETHDLLKNHVRTLHEEVNTSTAGILVTYSKHWKIYSQGAKHLDLLYHHFNLQYICRTRQSDADIEYGSPQENRKYLLQIGELALETWKELLIMPLSTKLVNSILTEILNHRKGMEVDDCNARTVIHSLVLVEEYKKKNALKLYEDVFETPFLEQTGDFFRNKANELLDDATCSSYMKQVLLLLTEEESLNRKFLHHSSYKKANLECQKRVIFDHVQFLQAGCRSMIRKDEREDLLHMYMLLKSSSDGLAHMVAEFEAHIKETGLELIRDIRNEGNVPLQFVKTVLEVHNRFHELVMLLFHGDKHFISALDRACVTIVNHSEANQPCKAPEMVCKYCDAILRRSSKGSTEDAIEKLKASITVFRYIDDKDVFQKFYSRALAKRLINSTCAMDLEEHMINRLKDVCGYDFTSKFHSMYTDVRLSSELTRKFHEKLSSADSLTTGMNANILQAGAWPLTSTQIECILPEIVLKCVQKFEQFYGKQFNGRNLTWLHHLSQAEVRMQTKAKSYFVTMSTYQLAIALLFNEANELTLNEIARSTRLQDKDLERNLTALLDAKILLKRTSQIGTDPVFIFNETMTNKRTRFKVTAMPTQREQVTEVQQTHSSVDDDRKLYLQAAIVRIMKSRKTIHHNQLMEEVILKSRMRFTPSVSAIKRSIEALIDKSYLERAPDSTDIYRYVA